MDAHHWSYRFLVLFFNCLLTFGSYYCFDMPSVLQSTIQGNRTCAANSSDCCADCLGMSPDNYNLLYAIYAWTNAVVVICAGFLIDKLGNRVGLFLFSFLCVVGSSIFALGAMFPGTKYMLPLMLLGRLIFGSGNGSLTIVQNRVTAFWFKDKELALAFGITLAFSRLGSVLNFFLTANITKAIGLQWTLWGGAILCGLGFLSALLVSFLDLRGTRQLGTADDIKTESKKLKVTDVKLLGTRFWLLALAVMFFYDGIFPFVADASKFIQDKYSYNETEASYIAGSVYDVSMVASPFLGGLIDIFGKRGYLAVTCAAGSIPVFGLLAFTSVHPLVSTLWLGVTYSVAAASLWPSIPLVVPLSTIGTAMGLTTSIQMIGIGISNVVVGNILGKSENLPRVEVLKRWKEVMIYLLANVLACVATAVSINVIDWRMGGRLNQSRQQRLQSVQVKDDEERDERSPLLDPDRPKVN